MKVEKNSKLYLYGVISRKKNNLTQNEVAISSGLSEKTIRNIEKGKDVLVSNLFDYLIACKVWK